MRPNLFIEMESWNFLVTSQNIVLPKVVSFLIKSGIKSKRWLEIIKIGLLLLSPSFLKSD